jgi:cytochrome c biogenesis protein CcmG, thiol:disulfide interchange protein DsbE
LAIAVLIVTGAGACSDDGGTDRLSEGLPDVAPDPGAADAGAVDLPYETFDGATTTLAAYKGRPLVVNFFSSWCTPCITEMPDFESVHEELGDEVAFVGMNYGGGGETVSGAKDIIKRTGITYDVGRDPDGALLEAFGGLTMPTTVLIHPDGTIAKVRSGAVSKGALRDLLRDELGVG